MLYFSEIISQKNEASQKYFRFSEMTKIIGVPRRGNSQKFHGKRLKNFRQSKKNQ